MFLAKWYFLLLKNLYFSSYDRLRNVNQQLVCTQCWALQLTPQLNQENEDFISSEQILSISLSTCIMNIFLLNRHISLSSTTGCITQHTITMKNLNTEYLHKQFYSSKIQVSMFTKISHTVLLSRYRWNLLTVAVAWCGRLKLGTFWREDGSEREGERERVEKRSREKLRKRRGREICLAI